MRDRESADCQECGRDFIKDMTEYKYKNSLCSNGIDYLLCSSPDGYLADKELGFAGVNLFFFFFFFFAYIDCGYSLEPPR